MVSILAILLAYDVGKPLVLNAIKLLRGEEELADVGCEIFAELASIGLKEMNGDEDSFIADFLLAFVTSATPIAAESISTWTLPRWSDVKRFCSDFGMQGLLLAMKQPAVREYVAKQFPWPERLTRFGEEVLRTALKHIIPQLLNPMNRTLIEDLSRGLGFKGIKSVLDLVEKQLEGKCEGKLANAGLKFVKSALKVTSKSVVMTGKKPKFADFVNDWGKVVRDLVEVAAADPTIYAPLQNIPVFGRFFLPDAVNASSNAQNPDAK
jgi:hypothetical protein